MTSKSEEPITFFFNVEVGAMAAAAIVRIGMNGMLRANREEDVDVVDPQRRFPKIERCEGRRIA